MIFMAQSIESSSPWQVDTFWFDVNSLNNAFEKVYSV